MNELPRSIACGTPSATLDSAIARHEVACSANRQSYSRLLQELRQLRKLEEKQMDAMRKRQARQQSDYDVHLEDAC